MKLQFKPYSFSAVKMFEQCRWKYYQNKYFSDKYPYVQGEAAKRGEQMHKHLENVVKYNAPIPEEHKILLGKYADDIVTLKRLGAKATAEEKVGISFKGEAIDYFARSDLFTRGIYDASLQWGNSCVIIDWKTGKSRYADIGQIELMAIAKFAKHPEIDKISGRLVFLDERKVIKGEYTRDNFDVYLNNWIERTAPITNAIHEVESKDVEDVFTKSTSPLCAWCNVEDCPYYKG